MATESFWCEAAAELHAAPEQVARQRSARSVRLSPRMVDLATNSAAISDYAVSLDQCTCMDCCTRRLPCKHMYRLAHELNAFDLGELDESLPDSSSEPLPVYQSVDTYKSGWERRFAWAVPTAYVDALATCRFERGDILYNTDHAYAQWSEALKHLKYHIQVRYPDRAASGSLQSERDADSVFRTNWGRSAEVMLKDYSAGTNERVFTTQGRIYTCLSTGQTDWLDTKNPEPRPPLLASDVLQCLKCIDLQDAAHLAFEQLTCAAGLASDAFVWLPHDSTDLALCTKYQRLQVALSERFIVNSRLLSLPCDPAHGARWYAPTVSIAEIRVHGCNAETLNVFAKSILFEPEAGKAGTFSMRRHGYLHGYRPQKREPPKNSRPEYIIAWLREELERRRIKAEARVSIPREMRRIPGEPT